MKVKLSLFFLLFIAAATSVQAQTTESLVKWSFAAKKKDPKTYEVVASAMLPKTWHIYSQTTPKGGPVATKITFKTNPLLILTGDPKESGALKTMHDQVFDVDVKYFNDKVDFVQLVKLKTAATTSVSGTVEYMICNDEKCLPPTKQNFDVKLQ
jgi:thiol:disulfide interchange protein DsbD